MKVRYSYNNHIYNVVGIDFDFSRAILRSRVAPETLMCKINLDNLIPCTGKRDRNGILIYEGDIVRSNEYPFMNEEQDNYYAEICWDDESGAFFYYTFKNPKFNDVCGLSTGNTGNLNEYEWEVVGNIYENPELLKE